MESKIYKALQYGDGFCYKNLNASEDEICYISENDFNEEEVVEFTSENIKYYGNTKEEVKNLLRTLMKDNSDIYNHSLFEEFVEVCFKHVINAITWQDVSTYLIEFDYEDEWNNFLTNKNI